MRTILFTCLLIGFAAFASADRFVVGVEAIDYYPLYSAEGGTYKGYARELLDAFAQDSGHTFNYRPFPVLRLTKTFLAGDVDFKMPDNPNWAESEKQGQKVVYSKPVAPYTDGVMVLPQNKGRGMEFLKKLTTLRGFTPWDYLGYIKDGKVSLNEVNNMTAMVRQVQNERADGAYFNVAVAQYFLQEKLNQPGTIVFDPSLPHTSSFYHLSTIQHPEVIDQFNQWLRDNAGRVKALKQKYSILD
ncbi:transporter substrate-binding domain-containing protein [Marinobacteraceae bacterium S3BR75-40.1]